MRPRVIDLLRRHHPGEWRYDARAYEWVGPFRVVGESRMCNRYEGDDGMDVVFIDADTGKAVPCLRPCYYSTTCP